MGIAVVAVLLCFVSPRRAQEAAINSVDGFFKSSTDTRSSCRRHQRLWPPNPFVLLLLIRLSAEIFLLGLGPHSAL